MPLISRTGAPRPGWWKVTLIPAAALLVHQLRYWLAYGPAASRELTAQGHSYLHSLTPWIVLVLALGLGAFLLRLARVRQSDAATRWSPLRFWFLASFALLAIYSAQEFLEGLLATGHPAGLIGVFGDGGWWAIPAAIAVGAVVTMLVRCGHAALGIVARLRGARRLPPRLKLRVHPCAYHAPAVAALATSATSPRAPPPVSASPATLGAAP